MSIIALRWLGATVKKPLNIIIENHQQQSLRIQCVQILLRFVNAVVFGVDGFDTCIRHTRLAGPHITTGHFDVIPGELRLKARESRCMTTFLAVCLRALCTSLEEGAHTVELKLCTVLATNLSNWSLYLEQCDFDLTYEQALHLHRTGHEWLNYVFLVQVF